MGRDTGHAPRRRLMAGVALTCIISVVGGVDTAAQATAAPTASATSSAQVQTATATTGLAACHKRIKHRKHLTKAQIRKRRHRLARRCRAARLAAAQTAARAAAEAAKAAPTAAPSVPCGPRTFLKADGTAWACSFSDEFSGSTLDEAKWSPVLTATSGQRTGYECLLGGQDNIAVGNDSLSLTARRLATPQVCASPYGDFTTSYTGGMVSSGHKFSQAYGRFEVRARFPGSTTPGLQASLWLYPQEESYGAWPRSGEIDIAEWFSGWGDRAIPHLHYDGEGNDPNATTTSCLIAEPGKYHTYAVEWTPFSITFLYDGNVCLRNTSWLPIGLIRPAPFDQPFMMILAQGIGMGANAPTSDTPFPATTQVDYVRAWS
jgi:beta-glucanase (GH16 family)